MPSYTHAHRHVLSLRDVRRWPLLLCLITLLGTFAAATSRPAHAATAATTVTVTVLSATNMSTGTCATGTPSVTDFGTILPGSSSVTPTDCVVVFGSSNDTSMLKVFQMDGYGQAMALAAWGTQASGTTNDLYSVAFASDGTRWTVGASGVVLATTVAGTTWSAQTSGTTNLLRSIAPISASVAWAVGSGGTIRQTTDGGATWTGETSGTAANLVHVFALDASHVWAVGASGTILATTNGGASWTAQTSGTTNALFSVVAADANNAWAVGASGTILKTTNGGSTWSAVTSGTTWGLESIARAGATLWIAGVNGTILLSSDSGTTWTSQASGTTNQLDGITAFDANNLWASGANGTVLHSTNGGVTWTAQSSGTTQEIESIAAWDPYTAAFAAHGGAIGSIPINPIADYGVGGDWSTGSNTFGACLRADSGTGIVPTWTVDAACAPATAAYWHAIAINDAAAGAEVAGTATSGVTNATANIRFGFKTATNQPPGAYLAPLVFETLAPNV